MTVFALFMALPMCCPFCVVPICGYCGAKHQDRGMLRFVNCQHGTGAIGGTMVILYCLYKLIGLMNDAGVSADDVSDAASHVSDSHVCDYTSACSWALAFVCWTVLLLTLHWCAFCAGYVPPPSCSAVRLRRRLTELVCLFRVKALNSLGAGATSYSQPAVMPMQTMTLQAQPAQPAPQPEV